MKNFFHCCPYSLFFLTVYMLFASGVIASAADSSSAMEAVSGLIVTNESPEPIEIGSLSLEQAHKTVIHALEVQDIVLAYEASISSPDKRFICTPFLHKHSDRNWRFLVLFKAGPRSRIIGYNLSGDEFKDIVEELYQTSMYHVHHDKS